MEARDEAGDSALHAAAGAGAKEAAAYLLDRKLPVDLTGAAGRTPLMSAVMGDQKAMASWLLRQGANPALKDVEGYSALMIAVREGRAGPVGELAPYQRENLDTALLLAALDGRTEVMIGASTVCWLGVKATGWPVALKLISHDAAVSLPSAWQIHGWRTTKSGIPLDGMVTLK